MRDPQLTLQMKYLALKKFKIYCKNLLQTESIGAPKLLLLLKCEVSANIMSVSSALELNLYKTFALNGSIFTAIVANSEWEKIFSLSSQIICL